MLTLLAASRTFRVTGRKRIKTSKHSVPFANSGKTKSARQAPQFFCIELHKTIKKRIIFQLLWILLPAPLVICVQRLPLVGQISSSEEPAILFPLMSHEENYLHYINISILVAIHTVPWQYQRQHLLYCWQRLPAISNWHGNRTFRIPRTWGWFHRFMPDFIHITFPMGKIEDLAKILWSSFDKINSDMIQNFPEIFPQSCCSSTGHFVTQEVYTLILANTMASCL